MKQNVDFSSLTHKSLGVTFDGLQLIICLYDSAPDKVFREEQKKENIKAGQQPMKF
jgi:hypothetical protein